MEDFSLEGVRLMFWGSVFLGSEKIIRLCEDLIFGGIFPIFAVNYENYGENVKKCKIFPKILYFCAWLENRNYYIWSIMGFGAGVRQSLKKSIGKLQNAETFQYLTKIFRKFVQKQDSYQNFYCACGSRGEARSFSHF